MSVQLKALRPFTEHVWGRGMVVFNEGSVDSLPADQAQRRLDSGFAARAKEERKAEPKTAQVVPSPQPVPPTPPPVAAVPVAARPAARRGRPPKLGIRARTASPSDAPVD